jgi:hypothetical protein
MPGAIHNYWLGIMALAFALALTTWISLVFMAGRHPGGKAQESWPHRDVMGGAFSAREGGRQVTPDPRLPPEPETEVEAERKATAGPPAPRQSPETGVGTVQETTGQETTGKETEVRTGRT